MTKEKQDRLRLNEKHLDDWRKRVSKMPLNLLAEALDVARDELSYQRDRVALIEAEVNRRAAEANADQLDAGAFLIVRQKGAIKHSYDYRFVPALLAAAEAAGENIAKLANQAIKPAEGYTIDKAKLNRLEKFGGEVAAIIRGMVVSERGADKFVLKPVAPAEGE